MYRPRRTRGLSEYPGYYCYDANRPSWLPYWLDSLTESGCKWSPKTVAGNLKSCLTGSPDCGTPSEAQKNPDLSGPGVAAPGEVSNTPDCTAFGEVYNPATNECEFAVSAIPTWALIAGAAFVGLMFMGGGTSRRYR